MFSSNHIVFFNFLFIGIKANMAEVLRIEYVIKLGSKSKLGIQFFFNLLRSRELNKILRQRACPHGRETN